MVAAPAAPLPPLRGGTMARADRMLARPAAPAADDAEAWRCVMPGPRAGHFSFARRVLTISRRHFGDNSEPSAGLARRGGALTRRGGALAFEIDFGASDRWRRPLRAHANSSAKVLFGPREAVSRRLGRTVGRTDEEMLAMAKALAEAAARQKLETKPPAKAPPPPVARPTPPVKPKTPPPPRLGEVAARVQRRLERLRAASPPVPESLAPAVLPDDDAESVESAAFREAAGSLERDPVFAARMQGEAVEAWIDAVAGRAGPALDDAPDDVLALRSNKGEGLARLGLDAASLQRLGLDDAGRDRVYRGLYVCLPERREKTPSEGRDSLGTTGRGGRPRPRRG